MAKMKFTYKGIHQLKRVYSQFFGLLCIVSFTAVAIFWWLGITLVPESERSPYFLSDPRSTLICFGFGFLLVAWGIGSLLLNLHPIVWIEEEGVRISCFLILKVFIPWSNIFDLGSGHPPKGYTLVRTHKITPFHSLYGWFYSYSLYPSFLIPPWIEDREVLIREIQRRIDRKKP